MSNFKLPGSFGFAPFGESNFRGLRLGVRGLGFRVSDVTEPGGAVPSRDSPDD